MAPHPAAMGRGARLCRVLRDERLARRIALAALLVLPPALLYSRGAADGLLSLIGVLFLATRVTAGRAAPRQSWTLQWSWALRPWHALALLFWAWQLGVTVALGDGHQIAEGIVLVRLFVFLAALEVWVLATPRARRWLGWVVLATALWVGIECWQQYLTGANAFGYPRWSDGALTGPMWDPRAGPTFLLVAFPAFLPVLAPRLAGRTTTARIAGIVGIVLMFATQVLIGQRMPVVLMLFGLCIAALLLPRLRLPVLVAAVAGGVLAALTPILSPPTYAKLVVHFSQQMGHFFATQYAQLFERATAMVVAHPWTGLGFDGFRDHCMDHVYWHNLPWFAVADPASPLGCNIHPHNYYLQVATGSGVPGLVLFVLLGLAWLWRLGHGAGRPGQGNQSQGNQSQGNQSRGNQSRGNPGLRVGLFVVAVMTLWPIASTTSLFTLPNAGWVFLAIGWGLAEARAAATLSATAMPSPAQPSGGTSPGAVSPGIISPGIIPTESQTATSRIFCLARFGAGL
ncbi:MAG: O-antigen ligase family protein [Acetobacteraceae bacterium]